MDEQTDIHARLMSQYRQVPTPVPFAALTVYSLPFIQRFFTILWLRHDGAQMNGRLGIRYVALFAHGARLWPQHIGVTGGCTSRRNQPALNPLFTVPVAFLFFTVYHHVDILGLNELLFSFPPMLELQQVNQVHLKVLWVKYQEMQSLREESLPTFLLTQIKFVEEG